MKFSHGWMADTDPEFLRVFLALNHGLPAQQKLDQVMEMYETVVATYTAEERLKRPEASDREIFLRVAARRLGVDLICRAYGTEARQILR
jgi:hypothetical protein